MGEAHSKRPINEIQWPKGGPIDAFTADVTLPKSHHARAGRLIQTHTAHRIQC